MVKIAIVGVITVIIAIFCKGLKNEYGVYVSVAGSLLIMIMAVDRLSAIVEIADKFVSYIKIDSSYISMLLKMLGISFVAEFSANICKDAGYNTVASQIELVGRLSILCISTPILEALLDTLFK